MGCTFGGKNNPTPDPVRRRLSVGTANGGGSVDEVDDCTHTRGQAATVDSKTLWETNAVQGGSNGRRFSIESLTDTNLVGYKDKQTQQKGDPVVSDNSDNITGIGYTCRKGLKPESPNQDSWMVLQVENQFSVYAVFDGHGKRGHEVSNIVKEALPKMIIRDERLFGDGGVNAENSGAVCSDAFTQMQADIVELQRLKKVEAQLSGTTATLVVHCHTSKMLHLAHVADSTAVLGKKVGNTVVGTALTRDHKPDLQDERARILSKGGRVIFDGYSNHRVYSKNGRYPGLNMSRCLGDIAGHVECGISCTPETSTHKITDNDEVLLVCSDGVWEFINPQEAVEMVVNESPKDAMKTAEALAKEAWDRWIREEGGHVVDDITVILVYL